MNNRRSLFALLPEIYCLLFAFFAFGGLLLSRAAASPTDLPAPRYTVTDLGTLPGGQSSEATALNDEGQVVGISDVGAGKPGLIVSHAFLWQSGVLHDIDTLTAEGKAQGTKALAISGKGEIVGTTWPETTSLPPLALGEFRTTSILFAYTGWRWQNGKMQIVGAEAIAANDNSQMLLGYDKHSQIQQGSTAKGVPPVPGFSFVTATALNNHGDIAGYCANGPAEEQGFVRLHGQVHLLGVLPGQDTSRAVALNDAGQVAGISSDEFHSRNGNSMTSGTRSSHAFFWQGGRLTDLGEREVSGLGAHGEVVGCYFPAAPLTAARQTAFLWQNGTFADLDTFIAPSAGWQLEDAVAVNKHGWIVGYGEHDGQQHAFLLIPIR